MSDDLVRVEPADALRPARAASTARLVLPSLIVDAGPVAVARFLEFFAARIANRRTRAAYGRAVGQFLAWCAARGLGLTAVSPLHVAAYIRTHPGSAPSVSTWCAARRQFGREPDPATVRRQARLDAGGAGGSGEAALNLQRRQPDHPIRGCGVGPVGADGADRFRAAVLQIPHVGGVPLLIRFRGPHGEQHAVAVAGVRHVGPAHGGDFRPPQPAHKQQRGDHGVESAPALRRGVGFDAPAVRAGTGGGGENRGEPVRAQRGGVGERGGPPPCVQARQRAEVGPSGVEAETRVGEPARGRRGDGQRPRRVGASG